MLPNFTPIRHPRSLDIPMTASTTDSRAVPPSSTMSLDFLTQPDAQLREPAGLAAALAKLDERLRESSIPYSDPLILDQEIVEADALLKDVVGTSKDPNFLENQKAQKILGFLELPTELLMDIMSRVTNGTSNIGLDGDDFVSSGEHNRSRDVEFIKSLRLTSRRMRNLADRFLIRSVTVRMMPQSLARLVEISHHPVFSHTVRCVRVNLAFYAKALANLNNFAGFEKWQCERIHERFGLANEKADIEEAEDHRVSDHTMTLLKRLDKEAIATREVKRGRDPFASLKTSFKRLLRAAHPWPRLERLELDNVTLTSGLLEELIGERTTDMIVRLESVFIDEEDEDTWREMLDMLRAKADPTRPRKEGGVCGTVFVEALFAPYGGEIIDFLKRDIERIFGSRVRLDDKAPLTPALSYLRGLRSKNPVPMVIGTPPLPPIHHLVDDVAW
ncbi:hypothetical protein K4K56_008102 [Colletotrichum sp. SAR 10_98]|nr:hypothetical protein K4K56_008102 [Colletotrichum sp. SAR 10_98]